MCGAKRYCREMVNCAEAYFYLNQCGLRRLDGDSDGVP
ncbi:excalibur calcium-binding domain-containing protein [Falsiroseomonas oryzae]